MTVAFTGANWSDLDGNRGQNATQAFQVITTLKQDNGQGGQASGKIFFIEISGGVKLQGLGFTDEPIIDIRGKVTLEVGDYVLSNGRHDQALQPGRLRHDQGHQDRQHRARPAARFVLQTGDTVSGDPEFWGVAKIQANFDFLKNYGIFADGEAMLQINTTPTEKTENIVLEGIPGDSIQKGLGAQPQRPVPPRCWAKWTCPPSWTSVLSGIDADPNKAGRADDQPGPAPRCRRSSRASSGRSLRRTRPIRPSSGRPTSSSTTRRPARSTCWPKGQTFVLPAQSFSIEIVGSLKIKANGSSDPNAEDAVRLFGGFFLRITPERFEMFIQAEAEIPVLGLNGKAVGLLIIDGNTAGPGLPGIGHDAEPPGSRSDPRPTTRAAATRPRRSTASSSCADRWW